MAYSDRDDRRPARTSRLLAGLSYFGGLSVLVLALLPRSHFVARHATTALGLHLLRFGWSLVILITWALLAGPEQPSVLGRVGLDAGLLFLTGFPWLTGIDPLLLLALSLPLSFTWLLAIGGMLVALSGRTADLSAFLNANWPDELPVRESPPRPRGDERARIRELTERRLERIWHASRVALIERRRREQIERIEQEMETVLGRLDHLNHLLSIGEVSLSRFNQTNAELVSYLTTLRAALIDLKERRVDVARVVAPAPVELGALEPVLARTLAVVDPGGIPIATYGHFPLDESLVTGMVSAFESLTAEMFGSRLHKTQLADGEVVHFARGRAVIAFAIFEDEPAPVQIARLREFLDEFESANARELARLPIDPSRLHPVPAPFEFTRRLRPTGT